MLITSHGNLPQLIGEKPGVSGVRNSELVQNLWHKVKDQTSFLVTNIWIPNVGFIGHIRRNSPTPVVYHFFMQFVSEDRLKESKTVDNQFIIIGEKFDCLLVPFSEILPIYILRNPDDLSKNMALIFADVYRQHPVKRVIFLHCFQSVKWFNLMI